MQISSSYGYTYTATVNKTANTNQISKTEETKDVQDNNNAKKEGYYAVEGFYNEYMDDRAKAIWNELVKEKGGEPPLAARGFIASSMYFSKTHGGKLPTTESDFNEIDNILKTGEYMKMDFTDYLKMMSDSEKLAPTKHPFFQEFYSLYTDESYSPLDLKA